MVDKKVRALVVGYQRSLSATGKHVSLLSIAGPEFEVVERGESGVGVNPTPFVFLYGYTGFQGVRPWPTVTTFSALVPPDCPVRSPLVIMN